MLDGCLTEGLAQLPLDTRFEQSKRHVEHDCFGRAPRPSRQASRELDDARARSTSCSTSHDGCAEDASVHSEAAAQPAEHSAVAHTEMSGSAQRCPQITAAMSRSAQRRTERTESARKAPMQPECDGPRFLVLVIETH